MAAASNTYLTAVLYRVTVKATGDVFYALPTGAPDGSCHEVRRAGKNKLTCTCADHLYRQRECKHILALRDHLNAKRAAAIIHQAEQIAAKASPPAPATPARRALTEQERRDTALPSCDDEPFSMFKS